MPANMGGTVIPDETFVRLAVFISELPVAITT